MFFRFWPVLIMSTLLWLFGMYYFSFLFLENLSLSEKETRIIDTAKTEFMSSRASIFCKNAFIFITNDSLTSDTKELLTGTFVLLSPPKVKDKWSRRPFGKYKPFPLSDIQSDYKGITTGSFQVKNHQVLSYIIWDNTFLTSTQEIPIMSLNSFEQTPKYYTIYYYFSLPDLDEYGCYSQFIDKPALQKNGKKHYEDQMTSYVTNLVSKLDNGGFR